MQQFSRLPHKLLNNSRLIMTLAHLCRFCHSIERARDEARWQFYLWWEEPEAETSSRPTVNVLKYISSFSEPHAHPSTKALASSRYCQCCGLLTIDPLGLRVMALEFRFEQILHSQLGVAPGLAVGCKNKTSHELLMSNMGMAKLIKHHFYPTRQ